MNLERKTISKEDEAQIKNVVFLVMGIILFLGSGYYIFFRLDFLAAPGLFFYFPKAYLSLFWVFFVGIGSIIWAIIGFKKNKKRGD